MGECNVDVAGGQPGERKRETGSGIQEGGGVGKGVGGGEGRRLIFFLGLFFDWGSGYLRGREEARRGRTKKKGDLS